MKRTCSIIIYGIVGEELLKLPFFIRAFFRESIYLKDPVIGYSLDELLEINDFLKYPIYCDNNIFGMLISISDGECAVFRMPKLLTRLRFKLLMMRYSIIPKLYHIT